MIERRLFLLLPLLLLSGLASAAVGEEDPLQLVRSTADRVLNEVRVRRAELEASPGKVYELVDQIVLPRFDFVYISRLVLGRHWRRATPQQRKEFTREFQELLVRTYATALLNYSDQQITYLPLRREADARVVTVSTRVTTSGVPPIPINYSLRRNSEQWKVFDVTIDGVSLVSNYRSSFASQIRRFKLQGLIERMRQLNGRE